MLLLLLLHLYVHLYMRMHVHMHLQPKVDVDFDPIFTPFLSSVCVVLLLSAHYPVDLVARNTELWKCLTH